jgi:hypothetical protein
VQAEVARVGARMAPPERRRRVRAGPRPLPPRRRLCGHHVPWPLRSTSSPRTIPRAVHNAVDATCDHISRSRVSENSGFARPLRFARRATCHTSSVDAAKLRSTRRDVIEERHGGGFYRLLYRTHRRRRSRTVRDRHVMRVLSRSSPRHTNSSSEGAGHGSVPRPSMADQARAASRSSAASATVGIACSGNAKVELALISQRT